MRRRAVVGLAPVDEAFEYPARNNSSGGIPSSWTSSSTSRPSLPPTREMPQPLPHQRRGRPLSSERGVGQMRLLPSLIEQPDQRQAAGSGASHGGTYAFAGAEGEDGPKRGEYGGEVDGGEEGEELAPGDAQGESGDLDGEDDGG